MSKRLPFLLTIFLIVSVFGVWFFIFNQEEPLETVQLSVSRKSDRTNNDQEIANDPFASSFSTFSPPRFIETLTSTEDIRMALSYNGADGWYSKTYTLEDSTTKIPLLSKLKREEGQYVYGDNYYDIFEAQGSHAYFGSSVYIMNPESEYSVSYVGFKINDRELISDLSIQFGIDFFAQTNMGLKEKNPSILDFVLGIESVEACGPGLYLRLVGNSGLVFVEESDGVAWYKLKTPVNLFDLNLHYCDNYSTPIPSYCVDEWGMPLAEPEECVQYDYCYYDATILDLKDGNLRMHISYTPNNKEGLLEIQLANMILSDQEGKYYQPIFNGFNNSYRAYLQ